MASGWGTKRILIVVRTYPVPANKGVEVSCTAGITEDGRWIRLFPVPYRYLPQVQRFEKYQWIEVMVQKAPSDPRPESHHLNIETIKLGSKISPGRGWVARKDLLSNLMRPSMCAIQRELIANGHPTLSLFKPDKIRRLRISKAERDDWTAGEKAILGQKSLDFHNAPNQQLEKIPYDFTYEFSCSDPACGGHKMKCTDWEMAEAYRQWSVRYGDQWEVKFREKFERDMIQKFDTHFFVGTLHQHPKNWMIVGLFYPPPAEPDFFR
jgi:hypothetical protein